MISLNGIQILKQLEGFKDKAYKCPAGIWTIGYGSTFYEDKKPIKKGDKIDLQGAENLLLNEVNIYINTINNNVKSAINQNQKDALILFAYNVGANAFKKSTLLKKVNINPLDITIKNEFLKWNKAKVNGVLTEIKGLTNRRLKEWELYNTKNL